MNDETMSLPELREKFKKRIVAHTSAEKESYVIKLADLINIISKYTHDWSDYTELYERLLIEAGATFPTAKQAYAIIQKINEPTKSVRQFNKTNEPPRKYIKCLDCNGAQGTVVDNIYVPCKTCDETGKNYIDYIPDGYRYDEGTGYMWDPVENEIFDRLMTEVKAGAIKTNMDYYIGETK